LHQSDFIISDDLLVEFWNELIYLPDSLLKWI